MTNILALPATWLALIAVAIFAVFERILAESVVHMSVDVYLLLRLPIMCVFLAFFARVLFGETYRTTVGTLLPYKISLIYWVRGGVWLLSLAALAVSMAVSPNQTFAYAWFILHPIWTLAFAKPLGQQVPPMRRQVAPILLTLAGALLFALAGDASHEVRGNCRVASVNAAEAETMRRWLGYIAPIAAGIFFALANLLTATARKATGANSTTLAFRSAYVSFFLMPVVIGLFYLVRMPVLCLDPSATKATSAILILVGACVLATIGTVFFTEAFSKPNANLPVLASLDLAIVVFAALIGLVLGDVSLTGSNALLSPKGGGLLLVLLGAAWSLFEQERKERQAKDGDQAT